MENACHCASVRHLAQLWEAVRVGDGSRMPGDDTTTQMSDRQILQRVDDRSLEVRRALDLLAVDVIKLTTQQVTLRTDVNHLETTIRGLERKLGIVKRSADDSGEHLAQELRNMHDLLAQKEREELERKLEAANLQLEQEKEERQEEAKDARKRRRDLAWKLLEWSLIGALAFGAGHVVALMRLGAAHAPVHTAPP